MDKLDDRLEDKLDIVFDHLGRISEYSVPLQEKCPECGFWLLAGYCRVCHKRVTK